MVARHPEPPRGTGDNEHDRRTGARVAYRWWERIDWLRWLFSRGGEMAGRLFAAAVIAGTGAWTAWDAVDARSRGKFLLPRISAERLSPVTRAYTIQGTDEEGRRAEFDLIVADKSFVWARGSTDQLSRNDKPLSAQEIQSIIFDPLVRARLKTASQLIAVGTASEEGDPTKEKHRAGLRADQTAKWLASVVDGKTTLWTLNLGQYQQPCTACDTNETSWQRPFLVIAVQRMSWNTNLGEALADALASASNLPSPERYSAFAMARFR